MTHPCPRGAGGDSRSSLRRPDEAYASLASLGSVGLQHNFHFAALAGFHQLRGAAPIGSNFKIAHAAEQAEDLARPAFRIGAVDLSNLLCSNHDLEAGGLCLKEHGRILRGDVGNQVSEAIDFQDHSAQGVFIESLGPRRSEANEIADLFSHAVEVHSLGQIRSDGGENVASMESIADGLQEIMIGSDVAHAEPLFPIVDQREHAVVGTYECVLLG